MHMYICTYVRTYVHTYEIPLYIRAEVIIYTFYIIEYPLYLMIEYSQILIYNLLVKMVILLFYIIF